MANLIRRADGVIIAQTKTTCKGHLIWVSTTTSGEEVGYWETSVFGADAQGNLDLDQEITEERHLFTEATYRAAEDKFSRDADRLVHIHESMVATLRLLDKGVVFSHANDIEDVLWAVNANDYQYLK